MKGKDLKTKLLKTGRTLTDISKALGTSTQNLNSILNASDVKSGTIEKLAKVLNMPIGYFYDSEGSTVNNVSATGVNTGASVNGDVKIINNERVKYLEEIVKEKERLIQVLLERK